MLQVVATELNLKIVQVKAVVDLLDEGATIPFIARYRKEKTQNLDEVQIRDIRDRWEYLTELEERKVAVLESIQEQGKLTEDLKKKIETSQTKQALEDLYLPFKPKRRTRATIAKELGLEPLAELIKLQQPYAAWIADFKATSGTNLEELEILKSTRDILSEWISEDAEIKARLRELCWSQGVIRTNVKKEFENQQTKYELYYDFNEEVSEIPAHRFLAIRRAEEEGVLRVKMEFPEEAMLAELTQKWIQPAQPGAKELELACQDALQRLILPSIEVDLRLELKNKSDEESITIFGKNLRELLLAPLGGDKVILGLDPGFRTGTKWVVISETGKLMSYGTIFPVEPQRQVERSQAELLAQIQKYKVQYICLGNGTASREVMQFVRDMLKDYKLTQITPVIVNESGASVYSASDLAREEFPDLDVSYRGSVSIARRFQDALAELVKIDPKSIGVGQYQHDVNQRKLKKNLEEVVQSCVNFVGVNLNTASYSLLSYVSGLNATLAKNIVEFRDQNGSFKTRKDLEKVPRFGPKAFEQAAGFLRIPEGSNPLDRSAVHPESYGLVERMAKDMGLNVAELIGNEGALAKVDKSKYVGGEVGLLTIKDILDELKKPGRDPRKEFVGAKLDDAVQTMNDLKPGMVLEGTVTNLTKFGAFVDIGVHQDGLIHVSEIADRYIEDPSEALGVGEVIKVKVLDVDVDRKRISLSAKQALQGGSANLGSFTGSTKPKAGKAAPKPEPKATGNIATDLAALREKFGSR